MEVKPATTYEQQIEKLRERGCYIRDERIAERILSQLNYYRFSAYFLPFRKEDETYREGTDFMTVYLIYEFDREMRLLLLGALEQVEIFMRSHLAYFHAHTYGPLGYENSGNYDKKHKHSTFMKNFNREVENNKKSPLVQHHKAHYGGKFPIWAAVELFTFGMTSKFFADLPRAKRIEFANSVIFENEKKVQSWLKCCTDLRNTGAHYGRLYYRRFSSIPASPDGWQKMGQMLIDEIIAVKMLYPDCNVWNDVYCEGIKRLISKYGNAINLNAIGFPEGWEDALIKAPPRGTSRESGKELVTSAN